MAETDGAGSILGPAPIRLRARTKARPTPAECSEVGDRQQRLAGEGPGEQPTDGPAQAAGQKVALAKGRRPRGSSAWLDRLAGSLRHQRQLGRAYQPRFGFSQLALSWLGALTAIGLLGALSFLSGYGLLAAPLAASWVLPFGYPVSPLAQPRTIVLGNCVGALIAVSLVALGGRGIRAVALAVGLTIAIGQICRCLHPPPGGVSFLGVVLGVSPTILLFPILTGSLSLVAMGWLFHRWRFHRWLFHRWLFLQGLKADDRYPAHWL